MKETSYTDSGVNIDLGDDVSKMLYNAAKETWKNREGQLGEVIVPFDDFSGVRAIDISSLPEGTLFNMNFDGVGTKVELAERIGNHSTIAFDLFAMVCDDAVIRGAEPVLVGSILDVKSLAGNKKDHIEEIKQLAKGYIDAAKEANVAIVNGEMAELGNRISGHGEFNYNWGAAVIWFAKKERMFTGKEIKEGDSLVGLKEEGFRSNGLSLVRKVLRDYYGENWHTRQWKTGKTIAEIALIPSRIYSRTLVDMFGGYNKNPRAKIHGAAHITGGGIPGKLGRALKASGLGARIDNPFNPPELMTHIQEIGNVSDKIAYETWNMGQGMIVITPEPEKAIAIAKEHGIEAQKIGQITSNPRIKIISKGFFAQQNPELVFN